MKENLRTVLLISGGGTTAEAVIKACHEEKLKGMMPVAVISSRIEAPGLSKAKALGVKILVIERKNFSTSEAFGEELLAELKKLKPDLVSQNGWLPLTPLEVVEEYKGRIINQHPGSLDPGRKFDFGGKGMYGTRVICACIAFAWLTGKDFFIEATTHFVTPEYDQGDLIRTIKIPIKTPKSREKLFEETKRLQSLLLPKEHENVIKTLEIFGAGKVTGYRRQEPLIAKDEVKHLEQAKKIAIELFPHG